MANSFANPIIPGFAPDPSIIRVEDTYFLVNSSFQVFPGLPIYASKNLKAWTHIGNAINRPSQLSLGHSVAMRGPIDDGSELIGMTGLLAPTVRYHAGRWYIICTNLGVLEGPKINLQNFYLVTDNIWANAWSDPIYYDWKGIDPSLFFDDDGRAYITGHWTIGDRLKQPTGTIKQAEVEIATGKLLTEPREVWSGWAKHDTEGPHLYKKDGWYYVLAAEGGTFQHHMLSIARSKDIWGPYEAHEQNPILTADGKDEYIQNTGHGDIFQDTEGQWWAAVLAIRRGNRGRNTMGRETFLTPVEWSEGGWPEFSQPTMQMSRKSTVLDLPDLDQAQAPVIGLVFLRDYCAESYTISSDCENIRLTASTSDFSSKAGTCTFVGKRQRHLDAMVSAKLTTIAGTGERLDAGLAVFKDNHRHAEIFYSTSKKRMILSWVKYRTNETVVHESTDIEVEDPEIEFKIEATENSYTFFSQVQGKRWVKAGEVDTLDLTCQDFSGPLLGIFAFGEGKADFERVRLDDGTSKGLDRGKL